jgi:hypothetical protein
MGYQGLGVKAFSLDLRLAGGIGLRFLSRLSFPRNFVFQEVGYNFN